MYTPKSIAAELGGIENEAMRKAYKKAFPSRPYLAEMELVEMEVLALVEHFAKPSPSRESHITDLAGAKLLAFRGAEIDSASTESESDGLADWQKVPEIEATAPETESQKTTHIYMGAETGAETKTKFSFRQFVKDAWTDYVGSEVLLAMMSFLGMAFSVYSWGHSMAAFGYFVAVMGNLWVLHAMKVSRDPNAWNSGDTGLATAFIFEAVTMACDMNLLYTLTPDWIAKMGKEVVDGVCVQQFDAQFWFALVFSSIALWFKFGAIYQSKNRTADAVQNQ